MDLLKVSRALISPCQRYRYRLERSWGDDRLLTFVMLNPSTADEHLDDPTIRRCMGFARREGCDGIVVANLYAWRATSPADLWKAVDPYGPDNDAALERVAREAQGPVVCGWGVHGGKNNRPIALMQNAGAVLVCLGHTKGGNPRHPLYVRGDQPFVPLFDRDVEDTRMQRIIFRCLTGLDTLLIPEGDDPERHVRRGLIVRVEACPTAPLETDP